MMSPLARHFSHGGAALRRALSWPSRLGAARRAMSELARMSSAELSDIGLVRQDVVDASMLRPNSDRRAARDRAASERPGLAA